MRLAAAIMVVTIAAAVTGLAAWPGPKRRDRLLILGVALAVRLSAGVLVWLALAARGQETLFGDEETFLKEADHVAAGEELTTHGYSNALGLVFRLTGHSVWQPRLLNVIAGAVLAVAVYELFRLLAGRKVAVYVGVGTAIWPSMVLWSILVLKDPPTLLALFVALLAAEHAAQGRSAGAGLAIVALVALEGLRPYAFVVATLALTIGVAWRALTVGLRRTALGALVVVAVGAFAMIQGRGFLGTAFIQESLTTETVAWARGESATGDTGFAETEPQDFGDVVRGLPLGLLHTMLGPLPWVTESKEARLFLAVELPLWWAALGLATVGAVRLVRNRLLIPWCVPLVLLVGIVAVLATYEGNAGTALRQRAMVVPIVLGLAAVAHTQRRRTAGRNEHEPPENRGSSPRLRWESALEP